MDKERLKVGVIGFGRMGRLYVEEIRRNPLWTLAYICDSDEETRKAAAMVAPEAVITDDEDDIFGDPDVNVVGLFTLADARPAQIREALKTGKHVLAEKPVADDIATEWEIVDAVERSGLMFTVNMCNRNAWYHKEMIDFIRSGEIGELAIVRVAHMTPGHMPQEGHEPEGPAFHDCGMHYVDVARWYAGGEYATYHAQGVRMWSHESPWWVQVHGAFQNGVVFDITQGSVYGHMAKDQTHNCYVDVIGSKGIARTTHDYKTATVELHGVTRTVIKTGDFKDKQIDVMIDVFGRSILAGKNLGFPTVRDSVIASDMAWKMLRDAEKNGAPCIGRPEEMDEILARRRAMTNGYGLPARRQKRSSHLPPK
ncbi:MAG: Gfo/Idh/MocA family oxidoreductase [Odoribacteraceae bacterium]|jgi:myo-inositol 2-dehydrogenase/D-chiro-inositol 1-dehydrogenase|nr:Gfo/Idh/MocA family oxidoreductase [Odoribacteraceae bacterium]